MSLPPNTACAGPASGRVQQGGRRHFVGVDWGDDGYGAYVAGHQEGDLFVIDEAETFRQGAAELELMLGRPGHRAKVTGL